MSENGKLDWETTALSKVLERIDAVTSPPTAAPAEGHGTRADAPDSGRASDFGWEESVLRRLRARLFSDEA